MAENHSSYEVQHIIWTVIILLCTKSGGVSGEVTIIGTSAVTGIPNQQALALKCRYTTNEKITQFRWSRKTGSNPNTYTQILSGSVTSKTAIFQDTWKYKGVFRGNYTSTLDIELPANHVTSSDAGTYRCEVLGTGGPGTGDVTASVLSAPSISEIPSSHRVNESSRLQINCSRYTTVVIPSTTSYIWTYKGSTVSSGAVLDISSISRSQAGQYTCKATNTQGSDSAPFSVDVQYGPGSSVTVSPHRSLERVEGSGPFSATCTADCNPPCSISWRKGSSNLPLGQLSISNITRTDEGYYTCQAKNGIGEPGQKSLTITVYYLMKPRLTLDRSDVKENDTVNLNCSVDSNPTAQMTIKNIDNDTVVVQRNTNTLSYTIQRVQCLHNGMFVCSADNQRTGGMSSGSNTLNVQCSPRHDFRKPFNKVGAQDFGKTASIVADVIANPAPTFTWYRLEGDSESAISNKTVHSVTSTSNQSVLEINITRIQDYGDYVVKVENTIGSNRLQFTLAARRRPSVPGNFKMLTAPGDTSVSLSWTSGFNGGGEQTFTLKYRAGTEWKTWKEEIPDPGLNKEVIENVRGLTPLTKYSFRVNGVNQYGVGDSTIVSVTTTERKDTSGLNTVAIGAGVGAGFAVIVITVIIVLLHRRGIFKSKEKDHHDGPICASTKEMTENELYVGGGDLAGGSSTAVNMGDVYAMPDKKNKGKEKESKGISEGDIYAKPKKKTISSKKDTKEADRKDKKKGKKGLAEDKKEAKPRRNRGDVYENTTPGQCGAKGSHANKGFEGDQHAASNNEDPRSGRNADGLMYVGIDFGNQKPSQRVRERQACTEYAGIAIGVVGPALPDDDAESSG